MKILDRFKKKTSPPFVPRRFSLVVAGHGVAITPRLPVGVAHLADGTLIVGPMRLGVAASQLRNALVRPGKPPRVIAKQASGPLVTFGDDHAETTKLVLGNDITELAPLIDRIELADRVAAWALVAPDHEFLWPAELTLRCDGDLNPRSWPYELSHEGTSDRLLFLQGPFSGKAIPRPDRLIAPNMALVDQGALPGTVAAVLWFELAYQHEGVEWFQRLYYLPLTSEAIYLMRAQAPRAHAPVMIAAADLVATTFRPR